MQTYHRYALLLLCAAGIFGIALYAFFNPFIYEPGFSAWDNMKPGDVLYAQHFPFGVEEVDQNGSILLRDFNGIQKRCMLPKDPEILSTVTGVRSLAVELVKTEDGSCLVNRALRPSGYRALKLMLSFAVLCSVFGVLLRKYRIRMSPQGLVITEKPHA